MATTFQGRPSDLLAEAQPPQPGDRLPQPTAQEPRQLALDTATGLVGEITRIAREHGAPVQIWLRPVGGGCEWTAAPDDVQRILHDSTCRCQGTGTISRIVPLADAVLITDQACPGGTA